MRKAARGAGFSWGLAAEAGKAARFACAHELPGVSAAEALLMRNDRRPYADTAPRINASPWVSPSGVLCPIATGTALAETPNEGAILLGCTAQPLLLLAFAARASRESAVKLAWPGAELTVSGHGVHGVDDSDALHAEQTPQVTWQRIDDAPSAAPCLSRRYGAAKVGDATWRRLSRLANRTYVPASDDSRARGAGA